MNLVILIGQMEVHSKDSENEINNEEEFLINSERNIYNGQ